MKRQQVSGLTFKVEIYKELAMSKIMQSTGADLPTKEIKGQRVVSYKQIAELHQVEVKNLQMNFKHNRT